MVDRHITDARLSAFLDDELDDDTALEVTRHLRVCDPCLQELESLRATRDALRRLPALQAPVLTSEVRPDRAAVRRLSRTAMAGCALALIVALLGGTAWVVGDDDGDVVPPVEMFLVDHVARTGGGPVPGPVELRDPGR